MQDQLNNLQQIEASSSVFAAILGVRSVVLGAMIRSMEERLFGLCGHTRLYFR